MVVHPRIVFDLSLVPLARLSHNQGLTTMPTGTSPEVLTFSMAESADLSWTYPEGWTSIRSLKGRFPTGFFLGIMVRDKTGSYDMAWFCHIKTQ